ncbi:hypothetical protein ES319_D10G203700v1 [Gossypium barbadense]|uniref:Uncharacterized protein n=3 Tax=Gossypium TaxID=3633 RepID=A0A5J5PTR4_GOSBA|nr:hypothetical protein ES319_D10G203700v1 [Gossypium barbadense]TYG50985.1 hypothetical protein ES288_D10G219600v1 [Gossypium darwinii]TYH50603.1 hypothetical protein ES332_D10G217700v1 [Gossypium tomentosum]
MALLKSATNHPGQFVQGNQGSVTAALQQIQDIKGDVNLGGPQRAMPMDPSSIYGQGIMQSKPGIGNTGFTFKEQETSQQLIGIEQSEFRIK